jgi:hypothetical protein
MSSFWDEIAKQYGNAENRYRENLNAGLGMLNNKANMIQQGYANAMNNISQQGNLLGQSMNIPAQFASMLANREENALTRNMQQDQFTKNYDLSKSDTESNISYRAGNLGLSQRQLKLAEDQFGFETKKVFEENKRLDDVTNTIYKGENVKLINQNPYLKTVYQNLIKEKKNEKDIFNELSTFSANYVKPSLSQNTNKKLTPSQKGRGMR